MLVIQELKRTYAMKYIDKSQYYLGGDVAKSCGLQKFRKFSTPTLKKKYQISNYHKITKPLTRTLFEILCSQYIFRNSATVKGREDKDDTKPP